MELTFGCLKREHVDPLVRMVEAMDPSEGRASSHRALLDEILLEELAGRGRFSALSRSVFHQGRLVGHVSARLVPLGRADQVRDSKTVLAYEDACLQGRLQDRDLRHLNRKGPGSVLILNSLFWDEESLGLIGGIQFPKAAIERIVRHFEGNYVRGFETIILSKFRPLVSPFLAAAEGSCEAQSFGKAHCKISVRGPWVRRGMFLDWGERLFTARPDYSDTDCLSVLRRHQSRVLHEFDFDVDSAGKAGMLSGWDKKAKEECRAVAGSLDLDPPKAKTQVKYPGVLTFRNAVKKKYKYDVVNDSGRAELVRIANLFRSKPSLITP